jgi:hypothetical protein
MRNARRQGFYKFNAEQATALLNETLGLPSQSGTLRPQRVSVEFLGEGVVRVVLESALFGKIPMVTQVIGEPVVNARGDVSLAVVSAKTGLVPLVGPLRNNAVAKLDALVAGNSDLAQVRTMISKIAFRGSDVGITVTPGG